MKKNLLVSSLLVFLTIVVIRGQGLEPRYGFRAGVNYSQISSFTFTKIDTDGVNTATTSNSIEDARFGFTAGFFAEYPFSDLVSIQPELQYSTEGNQDAELRLNYLQLPVFLKLNISEVFNIHLGPQIGFKVWEWERNKNFSTFQFSGIGGIGVNITDSFFVDLRYSLAFTELFEDNARIEIPIREESTATINGQERTIISFDRTTQLINIEGTSSYLQFTIGYRL